MVSAIVYTAPLVTAGVLLLTFSWCLDTSVPNGMPEKLSVTILDAVCRANWHIVSMSVAMTVRSQSKGKPTKMTRKPYS